MIKCLVGLGAGWRFAQSGKVGALHRYLMLKLCYLVVPSVCEGLIDSFSLVVPYVKICLCGNLFEC